MKTSTYTSLAFFLIAVIVGTYQFVVAKDDPFFEQTADPETSSSVSSTENVPEDVEEMEGEQDTLQTNALVTHVVDGDTFDATFDDGLEARIRMLGVNTPETVDPRRPVQCFGKEASDFMKELLSDQRVMLVPDPEADERDKYGRLLRNVLLADGTDVNAFMVSEGYAYAYLSFPLDPNRKAQLKQLEQDAKKNGRGLWDAQACAVEN